MKTFLIILTFFLLQNCTKPKSVLICGDHVCVNKAEAEQFFEDNLTIEVKIIDKKNKKKINLVELNLKDRHKILKKVINASSIFLGKYSPEAIGDYLAGPNHVLPTSGSAKFSSGLSVYDFLKRHSLINISKTGIERLGSSVINLAEYENLNAHANSIKIRLKKD